MKRIIAALFLAGITGAAFAQGTAQGTAQGDPADSQDVFVRDANSCPPDHYPLVPSYVWKDGHFVRNGELCKNVDDSHD